MRCFSYASFFDVLNINMLKFSIIIYVDTKVEIVKLILLEQIEILYKINVNSVACF